MDLTCKEASELLGLPEAQLLRWAAQRQAGFETGPQFNGSWMQPRYTRRDLEDWKAGCTTTVKYKTCGMEIDWFEPH